MRSKGRDMKPSYATILATAAFSVALLTTGYAQETRFLGGKVSGNVTMVSDYHDRGASLSDKDFALQGGLDYLHDSGFYVGSWASSIAPSAAGGDLELDLYGGYGRDIKGISFDVGAVFYAYPTGDHSEKTDFVEAYGSVGTDFGFAAIAVGAFYAFSNDATSHEDDIYGFGEVEVPVPHTPVTFVGHLGYEDGAFANNKWDWSVGAFIDYANLEFGVSYMESNVPGRDYGSAVVFSVGAGF